MSNKIRCLAAWGWVALSFVLATGYPVYAATQQPDEAPAAATLPYRNAHDDAVQVLQPGRMPEPDRSVSEFLPGRKHPLRIRADEPRPDADTAAKRLQLPSAVSRDTLLMPQPG